MTDFESEGLLALSLARFKKRSSAPLFVVGDVNLRRDVLTLLEWRLENKDVMPVERTRQV